MAFLSNTFFLLLLLIICFYFWIRQRLNYWSNRGVDHDSTLHFFRGGEHIGLLAKRIYDRFKNSGNPFVGILFLLEPTALIIDLDMLRNVFVTNFENFPDRGMYHNVRDDPLSGSLIRLTGEPWRRLRAKITPTFTSAKMRYMSGSVVQVAERFVSVINELVGPKGQELEIRDVCARFTTDVIGLVAFGIDCDSLKEPNTEFRVMGDRVFSSFNPLKNLLLMKFPRFAQLLHMRVFPTEMIEFYTRIVTANVEYREKHNIRRNDFLDILIELKNSQKDSEFNLTLTEVVGQAFIFFIGGFETSSSAMTFCLYELSQNQDIQERAREEVLECLKRHDNQMSFDCLNDMKYVKQVISETFRKYPAAPFLNRLTRKTFVEPRTKQVIECGVPVTVPVYAIHHDPEIYPDPSVFDPERFTDEAVQSRHPMAYLPFGAGPRICIAERFGRMQVLTGIVMLLRYFYFDSSTRTPKVLEFDGKKSNLSVPNGIPLRVTPI